MSANKIKWLRYIDKYGKNMNIINRENVEGSNRLNKKTDAQKQKSLYLIGVYYPKPKKRSDVPFEERCDNPDEKQLKHINDRIVGLPVTIEHPNSGLSLAKDFKRNTYGKCVYSQILKDGRAIFIAEIPFKSSIKSLSDARISIASSLLENDDSLRSVSLGHEYEVIMDNTSGQVLKEVFTPDHIAICKTNTQRKEGCHIISSFKGYSDMISGEKGIKDLASNRYMVESLMKDFSSGNKSVEEKGSEIDNKKGLSILDKIIKESSSSIDIDSQQQNTTHEDNSNIVENINTGGEYNAQQFQVNCSYNSSQSFIRKRKRDTISFNHQRQRYLIDKIKKKIEKKKSVTSRLREFLSSSTSYNGSNTISNSLKKKKTIRKEKKKISDNLSSKSKLVMNSEQQQVNIGNASSSTPSNNSSDKIPLDNHQNGGASGQNPNANQTSTNSSGNMNDDQSSVPNNQNDGVTTQQNVEVGDDIGIEDIEEMKKILENTPDEEKKREMLTLMADMLKEQTKKVKDMSGQLGQFQQKQLTLEKNDAIKKRDAIVEIFTNLASIDPDSEITDEQKKQISEAQRNQWKKSFPIENCRSVSELNAFNQGLDNLKTAFKTTVVASQDGMRKLQNSISEARRFKMENQQRANDFTRDIQKKMPMNNMSSPTERFTISPNNDIQRRLIEFGIRKRQRTNNRFRNNPYPTTQRSYFNRNQTPYGSMNNNSSTSSSSSSSSSFSSRLGDLGNNFTSRSVSVNASNTAPKIVERNPPQNQQRNLFAEKNEQQFAFFNQMAKKFNQSHHGWIPNTDSIGLNQ